MGGSKRQLRGYMYYLGIHFVLCHGPVDALEKLYFEDKLAWSGSAMDEIVGVSAAGIFGGYRRGLGVWGKMSVNSGHPTQGQDSYLVSRLGANVPAFRGVFSVVFRKMQLGFSEYLKKPAFMVSRIHATSNGATQWYDAKAAIGTDMNPAHIIRECLTDKSWGMGYVAEDIDDAVFRAAADTLYSEGMGMSILWNKGTRLKNFVDEIKEHINAFLFVHRETGKFNLKLIRDDYDVDDLLVLDQSNIVNLSNFRRMAVADLTSEVTIVYSDSESGENATVTARNLALANQQGTAVGARVEYRGFSDRTIATLVANRELKGLSVPLIACTIYATQVAHELNIGDAIKLNFDRYGLESIIMRVLSLEFGNIEDNVIRMDCAEDIFGTSDISFTVPPSSGWEPISADPVPVEFRSLIEVPYWDIVQEIGDVSAITLDEDACFFGITGVRPINAAINASLYVNDDGEYKEVTHTLPVNFCPTATLVSDITAGQESIIIENIEKEIMMEPGFYALINDEIILIDTVSEDYLTLTIKRGAGDTVPAIHLAEDRIFFVQDYYESNQVEYANGESVSVKLATRTGTGELSLVSAPADSITFDSRQVRPYPPGQFKINTEYFPFACDEDIVITWVGRNRITQSSELLSLTDDNVTPEVGTTYTCRLRDGDTDAIISTQTGLTVNTATFTAGAIGSHRRLKVEVWSVRDGYDSWQVQTHTFYHNVFMFEDDTVFQFENGDYYQFN